VDGSIRWNCPGLSCLKHELGRTWRCLRCNQCRGKFDDTGQLTKTVRSARVRSSERVVQRARK
jgi:hypothetical protein